jgi:hypothetical protein
MKTKNSQNFILNKNISRSKIIKEKNKEEKSKIKKYSLSRISSILKSKNKELIEVRNLKLSCIKKLKNKTVTSLQTDYLLDELKMCEFREKEIFNFISSVYNVLEVL